MLYNRTIEMSTCTRQDMRIMKIVKHKKHEQRKDINKLNSTN